ncbi:MAG TPA: N-acetylgalactosamine-4-sulfatase, partial [Schlesneria sp.]
LGHPTENPASLTSHDWITKGLPPWNQGDVRKGLAGKSNMGYWNVKVVEDGDYEIRLRRWPVAADAPLDASLSPGDPVPGGTAFRSHPGKAIPIVHATIEVGDQKAAIDVPSGAREAVFRLPLKAGVTRLNARFQTGEGQEVGAYYAYVERLTSLK